MKYNLTPSTSSSWMFYYRTLINLYESSTHRAYRKFNTCDNLLCVNFRIRDIVVCPFSTILTEHVEWWQLIDFENPDNKVRVVKNLYIIVSLKIG